MQKLSGLILDFPDDSSGEVLKSIWSSHESVPEVVKTASRRTPELEAKLPDNLFALVLRDGDYTLRKFACIDEGNTTLSVEYFLKTAHKLPAEAQQVGAENLVKACGWYGIEPPAELQKMATQEKIAIGLMGAAMGAMVIPGVVKQVGQNLRAAKAVGGNVVTPTQLQNIAAGMR